MLLRQCRFLSSFIPLLALFLGLGASQSALAQTSNASIRNVFVTYGASANTATAATFNAIPISATTRPPSDLIFDGTDFGQLDVSAGILLLQGGSIQIIERNGEIYDRAFIDYGVATGTFPALPNPVLNQTVELTTMSYNSGTMTRTFSLSAAGKNILLLATTAGNPPGTSHRFDIALRATGDDGSGRNPLTLSGGRRESVFNATGTPASSSIKANTIQIAPNGAANVTFNFNSATIPQFSGENLSSIDNGGTPYDLNTGQLLLNGTTVTTTEAGSSVISNVVLYYRTRLSAATGGAYQSITLTQTAGANGGTKTFMLVPGPNTPQPNLIATPAVTAPGTYSLDVYYQANGIRGGIPFTVVDPPTGDYTASFIVDGEIIAQTIWTGSKNDNWFDNANWTGGIPTTSTNALVRDLGTTNTNAYPNIYSNFRRTSTDGVLIYDNSNSGPAVTRNFVMSGTSSALRSIARLSEGRLIVYGDFGNNFGSFVQRETTEVEFGGNATLGNPGGNQTITGGIFTAVVVSGTGKKSVVNTMNVAESVTFISGILATDPSRPAESLIVLADRALMNNNNGAQLIGESEGSYIYGLVRTSNVNVLVGEARTYGNIGLAMTFTGTTNPGTVEVTRNTIEAYTLNGRFGIRRIFNVRPSDPSASTGGLTATLFFHYLDRETENLGGVDTKTPGTFSISEANLVLFASTTSGRSFIPLSRDGVVNTINNIVTKTGVNIFSAFTLGDRVNPLPVRLTAFDAQRVGTNALITWQTASEVNSKGYDIQVSTNGTEYRTLTSVPSASPNSTSVTNYRYEDKEANKTGLRYYRLRQIDLDGKETFFVPKSVSFSGKASETTLVAYPNPFNGNDELHLAVQVASAGKGQLRITDMTGRTIRQETVELTTGLSDLKVTGLNDLKSGVYLVRVTLPTGENKNLKVVKQ